MKYYDKKLLKAAKAGDLFEVQSLLVDGACPTVQDDLGNNALISAAKEGHLEIVQLILTCSKTHIDINAATKEGTTALIMAAKLGYAAIAERLVAAGANVNRQDRTGRTALIWAKQKGHPRVVAALEGKYFKFIRVLPEWSPPTPTKEEAPKVAFAPRKHRLAPSAGMTIGALFAGTALALLAMHTGGRSGSGKKPSTLSARGKAASAGSHSRHGHHHRGPGGGSSAVRNGGNATPGSKGSGGGRALWGSGPAQSPNKRPSNKR